jgi:hypothetical protein
MTGALPLAEALALLRRPDAAERWSALAGDPLLVVAFDGAADFEDAAAARTLAALPAPSVALASDAQTDAAQRWAPRFDVVVANEEQLATIAAAVSRAPIAAATLAQLLRGSESRPFEASLVAESLAYSTLLAGPEHAAWLATRAPRRRCEPAAAPPLRIRRDGDVLHLTLARPEKRNAFSTALRDALCESLVLVAHDDSIACVVLTADGPAFCAGGDLDEFGTAPDPATAHAVRSTRSAARALHAVAARVEARVHGACVGAGIELAAIAGRVIARRDAWFQLPELSMGLVPGAGGTASLPRRIGRQRTAWLALTGEKLDAERALAWGLVDAVE